MGYRVVEELQSATKNVSSVEVSEMAYKLIIPAIVKALDGGLLDGSAYPFDLTVGPGMLHWSIVTRARVAFSGLNLAIEMAGWILLEFLPFRLVAFEFGQTRSAVELQVAMQ